MRRRIAPRVSVPQRPEPSFQKPPLRLLLRETQGPVRKRLGLPLFAPVVGRGPPARHARDGNSPDRPAARMASMRASPAEGPSRMATAAARFSSITGDGSACNSTSYSPDDVSPVRSAASWVPGRAPPRSPLGSYMARLDATTTPVPPAILLPSSDPGSTASDLDPPRESRSPVGEVRAARRESCSSISASSPSRFRLREQLHQQSSQADGFARQIVPRERFA